ncbi:MAG: S41 family peptidase [Bacteroidota bacterium]|nr:S41 family peptidase [Bacteroidota bacterium]
MVYEFLHSGRLKWWFRGCLTALTLLPCQLGFAQDDLDSLDAWVRQMQPDPFVRCGEVSWMRSMNATREQWLDATYLEKVLLTNRLLQVLQDSHTAVSAYDWIWDVETVFGTLPIRWLIEGCALWTHDSGVLGLPEGVRILELNGLDAESVVKAAIDLAPMEGASTTATSRVGAHNITPYVLGTSERDTLTVTWVDPLSALPTTASWPTLRKKEARQAWKSISRRQPVVHWTYPDGSHLYKRDARRLAKSPKATMPLNGVTNLHVSSFSRGSWRGYERRLRLGFEKLQGHKGPLVINLRGNPGGQSYRMELLWRHFSNKRTHLPYALVAKQSAYTARLNGRHYRGFRKRWVDKHLETSPEARYIHAMATMPVGAVDTLFFPRKHPSVTRHRGPVALLIDGESASASVSFAGAFQDHEQGPVFGEACMGPSNGTLGNPCLRRLPISGVFVSLSTAMYMAQPGGDWAQSKPIQPDILVPDMWRNHAALQKAIDEWNQSLSAPK